MNGGRLDTHLPAASAGRAAEWNELLADSDAVLLQDSCMPPALGNEDQIPGVLPQLQQLTPATQLVTFRGDGPGRGSLLDPEAGFRRQQEPTLGAHEERVQGGVVHVHFE
eukprot:UN0298